MTLDEAIVAYREGRITKERALEIGRRYVREFFAKQAEEFIQRTSK